MGFALSKQKLSHKLVLVISWQYSGKVGRPGYFSCASPFKCKFFFHFSMSAAVFCGYWLSAAFSGKVWVFCIRLIFNDGLLFLVNPVIWIRVHSYPWDWCILLKLHLWTRRVHFAKLFHPVNLLRLFITHGYSLDPSEMFSGNNIDRRKCIPPAARDNPELLQK